jgi:cytochrome oxidase Cu insertion factor (SCO1/SenC/PrrC family)
MNRTLQSGNSVIVSAFRTSLLHQLLVVFLIATLCAIAFNVIRTIQYRRVRGTGLASSPATQTRAVPEADARRIIRIGFGCLWILDGLLQLQSSMPLGLPSNVLQPSGAGSPQWVQHLVNIGVTVWTDHPIQAAAATVWIQVGIGVWLLVAPRGRWSRLAGVVSLGWGLTVWSFGEAFGGIFAPGLTLLFGAPGAVLFYCIGGGLVALPERVFETPRLGRIMLRLGGGFLFGMAVLQAWPGRGSWQGRGGSLSGMVQTMAQTPQPRVLASTLRSFAAFDMAHGWAVNLFVVVALAVTGALFFSLRRRLVLSGLIGLAVLCVADWALVEDLGVFGGTGTDPNSMLPMLLLFVGGSVAAFRLPAATAAPAPDAFPVGVEAAVSVENHWWDRISPAYLGRCLAALAAIGIVLVGTAPMAVAAVNRNADPILSEALDGTPNVLDTPAPSFSLTDQHGRAVSLESLRGHVLALTFLDPVCTSDCPLIAQEFLRTDERLADQSKGVDFVAVVANPIYRSMSFTQQFDEQEGLTGLSNWYYLTGSLHELEHVWDSYGVLVDTVANGAMVAHSDLAFVIDAHGRERAALIDDPGPNQTYASSFSSLLLGRIQAVLPS